jgi:hypothetical protein
MTRVNTTSSGPFNVALRAQMQLALAAAMERLGRHRFDPRDFEIVPLAVSIPRLDSAFDGYRIVHLSDIHMGHWMTAARLAGLAQLVNAQSPDLVAITGDFVSYVLDEVAGDLVTGLSLLRPRDMAVATLGNHDHWLGAAGVRRLLRQGGVTDLSNDVCTVHRHGARLHVAGVDDVIVGQDRLDTVLNKLPSPDAAVLLCHEPDFADVSAASGRFHLQLSGHSHGTQLVLPRVGTFIRGHYFRKYPIGRYDVNGMTLYTNRGVGTNTIRLRINCPPEITVITLRSK